MANDRPIFDKEGFKNCETGESDAPETVQDDLDAGRPVNEAYGGIVNTSAPAPFITFNKARNEKILSNGDTYIVLGQDRPSTVISGEGGKGGTSPTIDLVVGRAASAHGGKGPCDGMFVGNLFASDAARIYISRSTKVDLNFGLMRTPDEETAEPDEAQRSAVAIKADNVRIIGRRGVKIVTGGAQNIGGVGRKGETDSFGQDITAAPSIDLIAGNYVGTKRWQSLDGKEETYLQPIALGFRTRDALEHLAGLVDHLMGLLYQNSLFTKTCFSGLGSALSPLSAVTGPTATQMTVFVDGPAYNLRQGMVEFEGLYLTERAPRAVWSRNVNST